MAFSHIKRLPMVGHHPALLEAQHLGQRVAPWDLPVNISGETGTGKELFARFIHAKSSRKDGPFVPVDCGMLSPEVARSELFGYVRGAFTGAHETRPGLVEKAVGGTLFLDEIGELDGVMQLQLLRLVQEGMFRRVGETAFRRADVRLLTATHRDLKGLMQARAFREDLYYRLCVVPIHLPPLRQRRSDIPLLIKHFCRALCGALPVRTFSPEAVAAMTAYDWPGNVRQLRHEVARLLVMAEGPVVDVAHLPTWIRGETGAVDAFALPFKEGRKRVVDQFSREYIHRALLRTKGHVSRAAEESGIGRQYFQLRMAEYGIRSKAYRRQSGVPGTPDP